MNATEEDHEKANEVAEQIHHDWQSLSATVPHQAPVDVPLGCHESDRSFD